MVLSSSLLSILTTCIQLYSSYQRDKRLLIAESFDVIERSFLSSLGSALWTFNFHQVESILDGISANGSINYIELVATTGHRWRRGENTDANDPNFRTFDLTHRRGASSPEQLGRLKIGLTLKEIRDRVWAQFWTLFLSNLVKTTLASLVMLILFHTLIARHLRDTARFVNEASWLEHGKPLRLKRQGTDDDLDKIVEAVNRAKTRVFSDVEQLKKTNTELARSNRQLDDFAYIASHDLKEPIRAICNHTTFLLEDSEGSLEEDSKLRLRRIIKLCQHGEKIVADLLYFSRLGRGDQAFEPLNLAKALKGIAAQNDDFITANKARLIIGADLPLVLGQRAHIETVFRNLIINGIKYNDSSDKVVEISFIDNDRADQRSDLGTFYVKDNGIGIDEEFNDEIFRIFKRLNAENAYGEGTGAGLTFVKQIIENHGGTIWFTSRLGEGTTFFFTVPLADTRSTKTEGQQAA